jgi:hypothetical protein
MGGTGKLVCPWGSGWTGSIETAPSNKFGGATRRECYPVLNQVLFFAPPFTYKCLSCRDLHLQRPIADRPWEKKTEIVCFPPLY